MSATSGVFPVRPSEGLIALGNLTLALRALAAGLPSEPGASSAFVPPPPHAEVRSPGAVHAALARALQLARAARCASSQAAQADPKVGILLRRVEDDACIAAAVFRVLDSSIGELAATETDTEVQPPPERADTAARASGLP